MKYTLSAFILGLVVLFSGVAANAQSLNKLSAKIDFDFHVAGKKFEAGDYIIQKVRPTSDSNVYHLRRRDEKAQTLFILMVENSNPWGIGENNYTLRFNRYGNEYFFTSIHNGKNTFKAKIPKSKVELQIAQNSSDCSIEEVSINTKSGK
jgi:hypothetical protein